MTFSFNATATREISNTDDVIDVRDIIARVEELREERGDHSGPFNWATAFAADAAELATLETFLSALKGNGGDEEWEGDWYPVTLIHQTYFVEYCKELVSDIGDMPKNIPSYIAIDWDQTAKNLKVDYSEAEFEGETFYYR